ncbi:histidine phosphatase family protein, partial [Escherichia coli]|uniref:histidine phosphatase family protein n=1 Tax=Escherichia coli TaxID=562 RepID=UPI00301C86FC
PNPTKGEVFQAFSQRVERFNASLSVFLHIQNILCVSHQGVLSLLIARLIGMPAEAKWHFRVDQGCWCTIDINQKFATLRVLNSRAIGVENA